MAVYDSANNTAWISADIPLPADLNRIEGNQTFFKQEVDNNSANLTAHAADNEVHILNEKIEDSNNNELMKFSASTTAVNEVTVKNADIGDSPGFQATGDDSNIDFNIETTGDGIVKADGLGLSMIALIYS